MDQTTTSHNQHPLPGPHFHPSLPNVRLEIRRGRARNLIRPIKEPVYLIGAARDCDLVLGDPQFPEIHAYLFVNEAGVSIRHIGHGPEITVDGTAVRNAPLEDGQRIRTGPFEFYVGIHWHEGGPGGLPRRQGRAEASFIEPLVEGDTIAKIERLLLQINEAQRDAPPPLRLYTGPAETDGTTDETMIRPTRRRERA